jgi:RNA polymerase sigma factor (sigma-70 family)
MEAQSLPRTGRLFLPRSAKVLRAFSDERLVEQIRRGNESAFETVYDRHHRGILSFCRHMLGSVDEAEDAVQQTFISAYDALRADERDIRLKAWLYAIARNRCLSTLRARHEQPAELDDVPTAGLSEQVEGRADLRELLRDLHGLPVNQRAALVLSEVGGLSHSEVGEVVGCEVSKVKSLVFQARSSLIETRKARAMPCTEIREQLATASGGVLRRGPLRRHIRECEGCAEFRDEVASQRKSLALLLPVVPTLGLKKAALTAVGFGGGGTGGGLAVLASSGVAVKLATVAVVAGVATGGGLLLDQRDHSPVAEAAGGQNGNNQAWPAPPAGTGPGAVTVAHRTPVKQVAQKKAAPTNSHHVAAKHKRADTAKPAPAVAPRKAPPTAQTGTRQRSRRAHAVPDKGGPAHHTHTHTHTHIHTHAPAHHPAPPVAAPPPSALQPSTPSAQPESTHHDHGHHYGWTRGRGHEHHEQDVNGYHVPPGHAEDHSHVGSGGDSEHHGEPDDHVGGHHH